jgi:hypothetical protein
MRMIYRFTTRIGMFYIGEKDGRFHPVYDDKSLGSYSTPQKAADDLALGVTYSIPSGFVTSALGIPRDLGAWERLASTKS